MANLGRCCYSCVAAKLVGGWPTPLKNMSSSVGMMTFPIYGNGIKAKCSKPPTSQSLESGKSQTPVDVLKTVHPLLWTRTCHLLAIWILLAADMPQSFAMDIHGCFIGAQKNIHFSGMPTNLHVSLRHRKWHIEIVDLPIKDGDFPVFFCKLTMSGIRWLDFSPDSPFSRSDVALISHDGS